MLRKPPLDTISSPVQVGGSAPQPLRSRTHSAWSIWILAVCLAAGLSILAIRVSAQIGRSQGPATSHAGHSLRQPTAITNGLVAWYPLDGNANDASGNGYNGTLKNFTYDGSTNGWTSGKFGKGLLLNGTNDYLSAGTPSAFAFANTTFTAAAWVRTTSSGGTFLAADGFNGGWYLTVNGGQVGVILKNGSSLVVIQTSTTGLNLADGAWHHIAVIIKTSTSSPSGNTAQVYADGQYVTTFTGSVYSYGAPTYGLTLGARQNGTTVFLNGTEDDIRIYNRALSASEITQLYQGSQPINCDQYCVGWWKLDGTGTSTVAADATYYGNNGTLTNFTFDNTTNGWTSGVFGNGLLVNGSNDYVSASNSTTLNMGTNDFTVSAWVKTTNVSGFPSIISNVNTAGQGGYGLVSSNNGNGLPYLQLYSAATQYVLLGSISDSDGNWHMVTGTRSGRDLAFYLDGIRTGFQTNAIPANLNVSSSASLLYIGRNLNGNYFKGSLDDVRIYSRALADYEIYEQYLAGH